MPVMHWDAIELGLLIFAAALLYSSAGQAGGSGFLAAMALIGVAPGVMKPAALVLNVLVASIATYKFYRARCFSASLFWPFALASVPLAFIGGAVPLPPEIYRPVVGVTLLYAALRLVLISAKEAGDLRPMRTGAALAAGALIGLLSGWTGIGGGILLTPLLVMTRWAEPKTAAGVAAPFILVNSAAALAGHAATVSSLPAVALSWAGAAVAGGWAGASLGSRHLAGSTIQRLLAVILAIAAVKLMLP